MVDQLGNVSRSPDTMRLVRHYELKTAHKLRHDCFDEIMRKLTKMAYKFTKALNKYDTMCIRGRACCYTVWNLESGILYTYLSSPGRMQISPGASNHEANELTKKLFFKLRFFNVQCYTMTLGAKINKLFPLFENKMKLISAKQ